MGGNTLSSNIVVVIAFFLALVSSTHAAGTSKRVDGNGSIRAMYNIGYSNEGALEADLADAFIKTHSVELGINDVNTALRIAYVEKTEVGSHIRLNQTYQGIPVHNGEVVLSTNAYGEVGMLVNNYRSNIRVSITSRHISEASAIAAVRTTLPAQAQLVGTKQDVVLMIWGDEKNTYHLTYRVRLTTENPAGDWEAFVDAKSGSILHIENRFANAEEVHVQGSGYVYLSDPLSAAKKRYGASGFVDNNDMDSDSLNFYRSRVTLDSLTFEDGVYKLKGPYCEIADIESPADPVYVNANKDGFNYTRSQQEFEAVNAFYHISNSYKYIQHLGFTSASLAAIRVDPHGLNGQDNSHYSPNGNWIAFGEGGIDDAEDVDAILHEYGHAIVFNLCPTWGGGESGALGEGYSDYWAASYSRSAKGWATTSYEYNWVYNWNAHNMFQLGRSLNDPRTYPFNTTDVHSAGQIWSSTLMLIWNDLGKEVTDKLVLKSLFYLGAGAMGGDAAQALIQADRDLFSGAHISSLVHWLGTVKHFIDPTTFIPAITHTQLKNIPLIAWAPVVSTVVSQNNTLESVWVEYKINSGSLRAFALNEIESGSYSAPFDLPVSAVQVGDTVYYRIAARYAGNHQGVAVTPDKAFYFFILVSPATSITEKELPSKFQLSQNYPNPFNPSTTISYGISEKATVSLCIYNMLGQTVATLVSDIQNEGTYSVSWNGTNSMGNSVASGSYFYRLDAETENGNHIGLQKKMIYIR